MTVSRSNLDGQRTPSARFRKEFSSCSCRGGPGGPFHTVAVVDIPGGTGPLAVGELTGDGIPDLLVVREDGKLQVVKATVEVKP